MDRRVVITGMGVISAIGIGVDSFWNALLDRSSGIKEISGFDLNGYRCRKAAEIKGFSHPEKWFNKLARASQYGIIATQEALKSSNLEASKDEIGIVLGTSLGGMSSGERYYRGEDSIRLILQSPYYGPSYEIAKYFNLSGPNITISIACASGTGAIGLGFEIIREGRADILVCGGIDELTPFVFSGFNILRATTDDSVRPFDRKRKGLALGEGAGILILEELSHAKKRGAEIFAEVLGYGLSSDAEHMTGPSRDGSGLARTIEMAINNSHINKNDIDFISAHGTGTVYNDRMETLAIKKVFGEKAYSIPVNSIKAMTGHCLGASGAIEVIMSIEAIEKGVIPPTINYENPDPECDLDYVPNLPRKADINISLSTSSAFGGNNAAVILSKFKVRGSKFKVQKADIRPVITAIGIVSPIGIGKNHFYGGLSSGISGISDISSFNPLPYQSRYAAEIKDFRPEDWLPFNADTMRRLDRVSSIAMTGSYLAIKDSGRSFEGERNGIVLGTAYGSLLTNEMFYRDLMINGPEGVSPFLFPYTIPSASTGEISIEFKIKGVNFTLSSGWTSGLDAIGWAAYMMKNGHADSMLAGGVDAYGEVLHKGLNRLNILSCNNEMSPYKMRGFVPGEGGAFFTLEDFSNALSRDAKIYAEVIGYGFSYSQDFERAIIKSIRDALREADIFPERMEALFLSANSTFIDKVELKAVNSVFGSGPEMFNLKPILGETFGAHGPFSVAAAILWERKFSIVGILSLCYTKKSSFLILKRM